MTSESAIQRAIQTACTDADTRLWRIQVGNFLLADGRRVISGVPGMADLIGLRSVIVTPAMLGARLAVFAAVEVKRSAATRHPPHQVAFIEQVLRMGGRAGFAASVEDAQRVLTCERG